jgi:hypothetical protein
LYLGYPGAIVIANPAETESSQKEMLYNELDINK